MRAEVAVLGIALVVTNVVWGIVHLRTEPARPVPQEKDAKDEIAVLRDEMRQLREECERGFRAAAARRAQPEPSTSSGRDGDPSAVKSASAPAPAPSAAAETRRPSPAAAALVTAGPSTGTSTAMTVAAVNGAKGDVLQIEDPARRERGLLALAEGMRSTDPQVANAALFSLAGLRDVAYDKKRFRPEVLQRLGDGDPVVQNAAAYALLQVEREPDDVDRLLNVAERAPVPPLGMLFTALNMGQRRVEGRLEPLWVKALNAADSPRAAVDTANYLRGMWLAPAVEDAVIDAWRRYPPGPGQGMGLWGHILGQLQPAPRESRVRAIFELLGSRDGESARQLTSNVMTNAVDPSARPVAAQLAIDALGKASESSMRRTLLDILSANGTRDQAPALRTFSENTMVGQDLRDAARKVAEVLERRP